jgi:uncharacterized membrane protein YraQ (UPF0718 family)/copper chaperone CopZ
MDYLVQFISDFFIILAQMAPYLLLGFFFSGVLHAFLPPRSIQKYLNGKPFLSSVYAAIFGVPLPLCSCGVIPTGIALYKNGASKASTVSFLISTPQTGVDSIFATYSLMGLPFAIIRPIVSFITGIFGGYSVGKLDKDTQREVILETKPIEQRSFKQKVGLVFKYGFIDFIQDIGKWLMIGLIVAALVSVLIPDNLMSVINLPPIAQMLIILLVSIPLYICATGSIPLAAVLILKGVSPGAAFILLMAGPATNAATISMIQKVLGKRTLVLFLSVIIIGALATGLLIDYVFPLSWFHIIDNGQFGMHQHHNMLQWWQIASGVILFVLLVYTSIKRYFMSRNPETESSCGCGCGSSCESESESNCNRDKKIRDMNEVKFHVEGMMCNHCKANVEKNVQALEFVKSVQVDLARKQVLVSGSDLDHQAIKECIVALGYNVME